MIGRWHLTVGAFAGVVVAAGSALAQQATVGIQTVTTYSADARITAVDPAARTVSLAFTNGATATRNVSQAVADFGARKVGDMVSVGFEDRLTFVLSGPNVATPRDRDTSVTAAASATGLGAAGVSASEAIANWWVVGVNPAGGTISLVNPAGGEVRTYNVTTPAGREQLPRVKIGDSLTAINPQVLVVSSTPRAEGALRKKVGARPGRRRTGGLAPRRRHGLLFVVGEALQRRLCFPQECLALVGGEIACLRVASRFLPGRDHFARARAQDTVRTVRVEAGRGQRDVTSW